MVLFFYVEGGLNTMKVRKDKQGRRLRKGEIQMPNGRYRFKFKDNKGNERVIYSWRLDYSDPELSDKQPDLSLREKEAQVNRDLDDNIEINGGNLTVLELTKRYVKTKVNVKPTTKKNYGTVLNLLSEDPFGKRRIDTVKTSDVKRWFIRLQQEEGKGYSSLCAIRGVLKPAFQAATEDDYIRKNPFLFKFADVVINDSKKRESLTESEEKQFLDFIKNDAHFSRYYEGIYILFNTGLRISEFCGLTVSDIDFKNHCINIDSQLHKNTINGVNTYYVDSPKTECSKRQVLMSSEVEICFRKIIENRNPPKVEPMVDGKTGFLYFDKKGSIMYSLHWEHYFKHIVEKYNKTHKVQMRRVTPHMCRHTFISKLAVSKVTPCLLKYMAGHSEFDTTMNVYTHIHFEDAKREMMRLFPKEFSNVVND